MNKAEINHNKNVDYIIKNPNVIGIEQRFLKVIAKEPMLLENKVLIGIPDILFIDRFCNNVIVEYKTSYHEKAYNQLKKYYDHLRNTNISGNFCKKLAWGDMYNIKNINIY